MPTEEELNAALDFLVSNVKTHNADYHHHTNENELQHCETLLRKAIVQLSKDRKDKEKGLILRWLKRGQ